MDRDDCEFRELVAESDGEVLGLLQLSFLPHLTYEGGWRAQIEGVRVAKKYRSRGVGKALLEAAIRRAEERGCHLVQLTTDRRRPDALKFYIELRVPGVASRAEAAFRPRHWLASDRCSRCGRESAQEAPRRGATRSDGP